MSEIRSQATPARDETKREMLNRLGMIHLAERYGTRLRLEPSHDNEIRVDITHSGGTESHFPDALDLLESVEAVVEHKGLRKPRTVNSIEEALTLPEGTVIRPGPIVWPRSGEISVNISDQRHYVHWTGSNCPDELATWMLPFTVLFTPGDAG